MELDMEGIFIHSTLNIMENDPPEECVESDRLPVDDAKHQATICFGFDPLLVSSPLLDESLFAKHMICTLSSSFESLATKDFTSCEPSKKSTFSFTASPTSIEVVVSIPSFPSLLDNEVGEIDIEIEIDPSKAMFEEGIDHITSMRYFCRMVCELEQKSLIMMQPVVGSVNKVGEHAQTAESKLAFSKSSINEWVKEIGIIPIAHATFDQHFKKDILEGLKDSHPTRWLDHLS
eukprot:Gb_12245 [translate_table: standard]